MGVIVAGDFFQLPPVAEKALYNTCKMTSPDIILGQQLYRLFNCTISLDIVKRQGGEDTESQGFRRALDNLCVNKVIHQD
jgi:ATP-dependent DNA helicase PIF1